MCFAVLYLRDTGGKTNDFLNEPECCPLTETQVRRRATNKIPILDLPEKSVFRLPKLNLVAFTVKNMNKFAIFRILNFVQNCYSFTLKLLYKSI